MILIITHKGDFTADYVINKLNKRHIKYKRFNCEDLFQNPFAIKFNGKMEYTILNEYDYKSVWFRRTKLPEFSGLKNSELFYVINETECFFKNLFYSLSSKWLSKPHAVYAAENKLLQLKTAQQIGFNIPKTLITNSKDELLNFYLENKEDIIIKPLYQTKIQSGESDEFIFTNPIPKNIIDEIDHFDLTPCIFQQNIAKEYEIRATLVGEQVFSSAVYSQEDYETKADWRKKKLKFVKTTLPEEIERLCIQILKQLNLEFGAIDLIKTPQGEYVFLEINPNGQWVWIENQTGQKISESIIDFLTA